MAFFVLTATELSRQSPSWSVFHFVSFSSPIHPILGCPWLSKTHMTGYSWLFWMNPCHHVQILCLLHLFIVKHSCLMKLLKLCVLPPSPNSYYTYSLCVPGLSLQDSRYTLKTTVKRVVKSMASIFFSFHFNWKQNKTYSQAEGALQGRHTGSFPMALGFRNLELPTLISK